MNEWSHKTLRLVRWAMSTRILGGLLNFRNRNGGTKGFKQFYSGLTKNQGGHPAVDSREWVYPYQFVSGEGVQYIGDIPGETVRPIDALVHNNFDAANFTDVSTASVRYPGMYTGTLRKIQQKRAAYGLPIGMFNCTWDRSHGIYAPNDNQGNVWLIEVRSAGVFAALLSNSDFVKELDLSGNRKEFHDWLYIGDFPATGDFVQIGDSDEELYDEWSYIFPEAGWKFSLSGAKAQIVGQQTVQAEGAPEGDEWLRTSRWQLQISGGTDEDDPLSDPPAATMSNIERKYCYGPRVNLFKWPNYFDGLHYWVDTFRGVFIRPEDVVDAPLYVWFQGESEQEIRYHSEDGSGWDVLVEDTRSNEPAYDFTGPCVANTGSQISLEGTLGHVINRTYVNSDRCWFTSPGYPEEEPAGSYLETGIRWGDVVSFNQSLNQTTSCTGFFCARSAEQWHVRRNTWNSISGTKAVGDFVIVPWIEAEAVYHYRTIFDDKPAYNEGYITVAAHINASNGRCRPSGGTTFTPVSAEVSRVFSNNVGDSGAVNIPESETQTYDGFVMMSADTVRLDGVTAGQFGTFATLEPTAIILYAGQDLFTDNYLAQINHFDRERISNASYPTDADEYDEIEGFLTFWVGDSTTA